MKRIVSLILTALLVVSMFVPTIATATDDVDYNSYLEKIIDNYKLHSAEEIAEFKAEIKQRGMLDELLYPGVCANVYVVTNANRKWSSENRLSKTHRNDVFAQDSVVMGVMADNGYLNISCARVREPIARVDYNFETMEIEVVGYDRFPDGHVYGSDEGGQICQLNFDDLQVVMNSMSKTERENFLLELYLSILDTDEAIGLVTIRFNGGYYSSYEYDNSVVGKVDPLTTRVIDGVPCDKEVAEIEADGNNYLAVKTDAVDVAKGDVNGDGKINSIDSSIMVRYLSGKIDSIDETNADVNDDGKINSADALALKQLICGN